MAPQPATAKIDLKYPLYACDFDPSNPNFLLVGGGGGESRSGVPNKITLLDTSQRNELSEVVDIALTNQEDNVQTLAYAQSTDSWATALAGINSSQAEQKAGKNEHLRSFLLEYPLRRRTIAQGPQAAEKDVRQAHTGQTKALGRAALFTPSSAAEKLTYQRVLRLSKKVEGNGPRLGVVATGLAPEGEIVVFAADTSRPGKDDIRARLTLGEKIEAADVDITALEADEKRGNGNFRLAYCTDYEIYCTDVNYTYNRPGGVEPRQIYGTGYPGASGPAPSRPKFRCLRLLTPTLVLVLQNLPKQKGSELFVVEISGAILARKRLHGKIKSATGLTVAALPYPEDYNHMQHAIAVAGADRSITILTIDHPASSPYGRKLSFRKYAFIPNVHENSIMSLIFSQHNPPDTPYVSAPTQYLKLASTSMVNTCVVHTMVLAPHPSPSSKEDRPAYLLSPAAKSSMTENTFSVLIAIIAIAIGSFFLQAFTEIRGGAPEYLGAKQWLPPAVHNWVARPYMFEDGVKSAWSRSISSEVETVSSFISSVVETPSSILSEAGSTASSAVSSVASSGSSIVSEAASSPLKEASKAGSKISSAASSKSSSISGKASEGASLVFSSAGEEVSGASSVLSEAASSASSSLSEGVSKVSSKISKHGSSVSHKASDGVSPAVASASSKGSAAIHAASDGVSAAAASASSMASSAGNVASSAASLASSAASSAGAPVSSSASSMAAQAAEVASSASSVAAEAAASAGSEGGSSGYSVVSSGSSIVHSVASSGSKAASSYASVAHSGASGAASTASSKLANAADTAQERLGLRALLAARGTGSNQKGSDDSNVPHEIIVRHSEEESGLSVETHPAENVVEKEMKVKRWEDLNKKEKASWKKRLQDAGEWTLEEGESVLKGVLFSGLGNIVGAALGG